MSEEPRPVFAVKDVIVEERIEAWVEEGVVEVAGDDELEETLESGDCEGEIWRAEREAVGEEVHQDFGTAQGGEDCRILELLEESLLLGFAHGCAERAVPLFVGHDATGLDRSFERACRFWSPVV